LQAYPEALAHAPRYPSLNDAELANLKLLLESADLCSLTSSSTTHLPFSPKTPQAVDCRSLKRSDEKGKIHCDWERGG
jgi:hypothetical protein